MGTVLDPVLDHRRSVPLVFLCRLICIIRPPCAIWPLPLLRDIEQTGLSSSEDMEAMAKESVLWP